MEYWDLLDHHRRPTGETLRRGDPLPPGRYHTIIGVWTIHDGLRRLLITKRHPDKLICPNQWENTGGSILAGETSCHGAAREVREETGMDCHCGDLTLLRTLRIPTAFVDCYIYHTTIDPEAIVLQEGETVDWRWVTLAELEAIIAAGQFSEPEIVQYEACREDLAQALEGDRTDPFYSESNIRYLEQKIADYRARRLPFAQHPLIDEQEQEPSCDQPPKAH